MDYLAVSLVVDFISSVAVLIGAAGLRKPSQLPRRPPTCSNQLKTCQRPERTAAGDRLDTCSKQGIHSVTQGYVCMKPSHEVLSH